MTACRLLYLTDDQLSAYCWKRRHLTQEGCFSASDDGLEQFTSYLERNKRSLFRVLANLRDESHQLEIIPYLRGKDRDALLSRKFSQSFFGTPLTTAFSLGYEKTQRKNERVLLSALTCNADFQPWLARITASGGLLAGVYSLSQLGGALLKEYRHLPEQCLLLTMQDNSLRESYIVKGQTLFSRLVLAPGQDMTADFAGEATKLRQYLMGQGLLRSEDILPIFILADGVLTGAPQQPSSESAPLSFTVLSGRFLAKKMGLKIIPSNPCGEFTFLHLLATKPPRQQYAREELRQDYRVWQVKRVLAAVLATALLIALPLASLGFYESRIYRQETEQLLAHEKELAKDYGQLLAKLPRLEIDYDTLHRVTNRFVELQGLRRAPTEAYKIVSRALERSPAIRLDVIDWKSDSGASSPSSCCQERIVVEGTILSEKPNSPRQVSSAFGDFIQALERDPSNKVSVRRWPFNLNSGESHSVTELGHEAPQAFSVEIIRKPSP